MSPRTALLFDATVFAIFAGACAAAMTLPARPHTSPEMYAVSKLACGAVMGAAAVHALYAAVRVAVRDALREPR